MNKTKYILLVAAAILAACKNGLEPTFSVGADDNAIVLAAGISDGGGGVVTRAVANPDANHSSHVSLKENTIMRLRVDGDWWKTAEAQSATEIKQITDAKAGNIVTNTNDKHRQLKDYSPQLYWDDYGTADPNNTSTTSPGKGREKGLTIYGVAVDGESTLPSTLSSLSTTVSTWQSLSWNVGTPSTGANPAIDQQSGWANYDLLTSNNVVYSPTESEDNAYKFKDRASGKLLEFTHAMTKVTVNLTAGKGFPGYETSAEDAKFVTAPSVTLLGFNYIGKVNIETKISTPTQADGTTETSPVATTNVQMHSTTGNNVHLAILDALVFPGNTFSATIADDAPKYTPTSETVILELNADGNIFKVTAAQLVKAIVGTSTTGTPVYGTLEQGKNYVLNITVNKTGIDVEATIKDWVDVTAANEAPVINVNQAYGYNGTAFSTDKSFSFLRSTTKTASYNKDAQMNYTQSSNSCVLDPVLYWPDHDTHFFFRATWPVIAESGTAGEYIPNGNFVGNNAITVVNEKFNAGHFPSEMMLGYPRISDADGSADETCKAGHKEDDGTTPKAGICATEGNINMDFRYAMSQVIVELKTNEDAGATNRVTFDADTKVEIIGGYTSGKLMLADGTSDFTDQTITVYKMNNKADEDYDSFHDAVIPQALTNASGDLRFRITVKTGTTLDKYETVLGIKSIKVNGDQTITAWEPGKKYTYTLMITKTGIQVTATLKDWVEVTASEPVWF